MKPPEKASVGAPKATSKKKRPGLPGLLPVPKRASVIHDSENAIQTAILNGVLTDYLPPERDLCDQLAISRSTLRVVLKNLGAGGWIKVEHGRRTQICHEKGAAPERPPQGGRNLLLLSPFSQLSLDTAAFWIDEFRRLLYLLGYTLVTEHLHKIGNRRVDYWLPELKKKYDPALWILLSCPEAASVWLANEGLPALVAGLPHSRADLPSICFDFHASCRHAAGHLISLGHRRIGLVAPQPLLPGDRQSVLGFNEGVEAHRGDDVEGVLIPYQNNAESTFNSLRREFGQKRHATALILCRPSAVIGVISSLSALGLRVPDDVSIICRDYSPALFDAIWPPLAHYYCDPTKVARKYVSTFLKLQAGNPLLKRHSFILPEYRNGESVRALKR